MDGTIFRIILLQSTTIVIVEILAIAQLKNWLRIIRWEDMYHSRSKFKWIFNICIYIYIHRQSQTHTYIIYLSSFNSKMVMWNCMQDDYYTNNHLNLCSQKNFNKTTNTKQFRVNTFYATCRIMIISNMPFCGSDRSKCNWIKLLRWWWSHLNPGADLACHILDPKRCSSSCKWIQKQSHRDRIPILGDHNP